jgi:hypothetical protein
MLASRPPFRNIGVDIESQTRCTSILYVPYIVNFKSNHSQTAVAAPTPPSSFARAASLNSRPSQLNTMTRPSSESVRAMYSVPSTVGPGCMAFAHPPDVGVSHIASRPSCSFPLFPPSSILPSSNNRKAAHIPFSSSPSPLLKRRDTWAYRHLKDSS